MNRFKASHDALSPDYLRVVEESRRNITGMVMSEFYTILPWLDSFFFVIRRFIFI